MIRWLLRRKLATFEKTYDYDMTYAREILDAAGPDALLRFARVQGMGQYRAGVPLEAWFAAKVAAMAVEDCGPCTQLAVTMALRAGVSGAVLRAVIAHDDAALPPDACLAVAFVRSAMARDDEADDLRARVVERFGPRGLVTLAYVATVARIYPTLKYALGHGQACQLVRIGETLVPHAA